MRIAKLHPLTELRLGCNCAGIVPLSKARDGVKAHLCKSVMNRCTILYRFPYSDRRKHSANYSPFLCAPKQPLKTGHENTGSRKMCIGLSPSLELVWRTQLYCKENMRRALSQARKAAA